MANTFPAPTDEPLKNQEIQEIQDEQKRFAL